MQDLTKIQIPGFACMKENIMKSCEGPCEFASIWACTKNPATTKSLSKMRERMSSCKETGYGYQQHWNLAKLYMCIGATAICSAPSRHLRKSFALLMGYILSTMINNKLMTLQKWVYMIFPPFPKDNKLQVSGEEPKGCNLSSYYYYTVTRQ